MTYNFDERQFIEAAAWAYYNSYETGMGIVKLSNKEIPLIKEIVEFFNHHDLNKLTPEIKNIFEAEKKSFDIKTKIK